MRANFTWFSLLLFLLWSVGVMATPSAEDIITSMAFKQDQVAELERGKIVDVEISEATQKELAMGLAMYLPSSPAKIATYFKTGDLALIDSDITTHASIQPNSGIDAFKGFSFTLKQSDEARDLMAAAAGDRFNLSAEEIKGFAALKEKLAGADKAALVADVSQHYRQILLQRWQAYLEGGLAGIASYARNGADAKPAEELRTAAASSKLFANFFPDLHKVWLNYPEKLPSGAEEQFFWINRTVENRPTAILSHRIVQTSDTVSVIIARQFFVGHSYNSSHLIVGCLPYRDGSIVFYAQRTSTDQVAGLGSSLKHSIGREQLKKQMIKNLERLRSNIQSP